MAAQNCEGPVPAIADDEASACSVWRPDRQISTRSSAVPQARRRAQAWLRILDALAEQRQALEYRIWLEDHEDTVLASDCQSWCELAAAVADFLKARRSA